MLLLALLLSVAVLLIATSLTQGFTGEPAEYVFHVGRERSYGEFLEYVMTLWIVLMLAVMWWRVRATVLAVWVVVFCWFGLDNAFSVHEGAGEWMASHVHVVGHAGPYAKHVGEVIFVATVGAVGLGSLLLAHRGCRGLARWLSTRLFALTGALVFFGFLVDAVHAIVTVAGAPWAIHVLLTVVEDGGELVVLSVATVSVFAVVTATVTDRPTTPWTDSAANQPGTTQHRGATSDEPHEQRVAARVP